MKIALLLPAFNEEQTIEAVIREFDKQDSEFDIWVIDNNSTDQTAKIAERVLKKARKSGGLLKESRAGKGNAIRRGLLEVQADIYVICDADTTYPADKIFDLVKPIIENTADMTVGDRQTNGSYRVENKRTFHNFGNKFVAGLVNYFFKAKLVDIMSGYRAFSKKVASHYPALASGFELETDLTLFCLDKKFRIIEVPINYKDRPEGSESKLNTISDGAKVLRLIFTILRFYKPFQFFGLLSLVSFISGLAVGSVPIMEYLATSTVEHVPLSILASGFVLTSLLFFAIALILDSISINNMSQIQIQIRRK